MAVQHITKRTIDALSTTRHHEYVWDNELPGFGVRVTAAGFKAYVVQYRLPGLGRRGTVKRVTLGAHGALTPDEARRLAKRELGKVAQGVDPAAERAARKEAPTIEELEKQIAAEVSEFEMHPEAKKWILARLERFTGSKTKELADQKRSLDNTLRATELQLDALTRLHVRGLITEEEFLRQRQALQHEHARMKQRHDLLDKRADWIEPGRELVDFSIRAADYFLTAKPPTKRLILSTVGSNPTLGAGMFSMEVSCPGFRGHHV